MGLAGARACEGGWLSGPVIHEDSRGHRVAPADTSWSSKSVINEDSRVQTKIACRRGESNPYVLADRRV